MLLRCCEPLWRSDWLSLCTCVFSTASLMAAKEGTGSRPGQQTSPASHWLGSLLHSTRERAFRGCECVGQQGFSRQWAQHLVRQGVHCCLLHQRPTHRQHRTLLFGCNSESSAPVALLGRMGGEGDCWLSERESSSVCYSDSFQRRAAPTASYVRL